MLEDVFQHLFEAPSRLLATRKMHLSKQGFILGRAGKTLDFDLPNERLLGWEIGWKKPPKKQEVKDPRREKQHTPRRHSWRLHPHEHLAIIYGIGKRRLEQRLDLDVAYKAALRSEQVVPRSTCDQSTAFPSSAFNIASSQMCIARLLPSRKGWRRSSRRIFRWSDRRPIGAFLGYVQLRWQDREQARGRKHWVKCFA